MMSNILLSEKFESLHTLANLGIVWWTSSVVFMATAIAVSWKYKTDLTNDKYLTAFKKVFFLFILTVIFFGFFMSIVVLIIEYEIHTIINIDSNFVFIDTVGFYPIALSIGYLIGTSSFCFAAWILVGLRPK